MKNQDFIKKYLKEHCLTSEMIAKYDLGVYYGTNRTPGHIKIPIVSDSRAIFNKYRMFGDRQKYLYEKGSTMALYNADRIMDAKVVWIVEGEFDAIALTEFFASTNQKGWVAVSSTGGSGTWNEDWNERLEDKTVCILLDNDKAGMEGSFRLWEKIGKDCSDVSVYRHLTAHDNPGFKDCCELIYSLYEPFNFLSQVMLVIPNDVSYMEIENATAQQKGVAANRVIAKLKEWEATYDGSLSSEWLMHFSGFLTTIYHRERPRKNPKESVPSDYEVSLDMLRKIPITNFVRFKNNVATCVFHSERNPSMHYNPPESKFPNTVKCYSCGKFGGVVDVVMALNNVGFSEAVEILKKHI